MSVAISQKSVQWGGTNPPENHKLTAREPIARKMAGWKSGQYGVESIHKKSSPVLFTKLVEVKTGRRNSMAGTGVGALIAITGHGPTLPEGITSRLSERGDKTRRRDHLPTCSIQSWGTEGPHLAGM
ncbi:hypothetical protein AVEN_38708-1 [Araneus ventricosus]|uniref:Uncharacterized protein n=1 Tax=Araneus ventricosus TaxID=182803 RepID=A0A4Y2GTU3_ARAVE|nr:hypothetical protein AVEN_38708-1 [Araneus ventricosus]